MSSVNENCLAPGDPCSLSPSVLSSLASSLGVTQTVTVAPDASQSSGPILTVGAEVGIAVGAVCVVVVIGFLLVLLRRRRRRGKHVVEIDLGDPPSPAMAEASLPHFPRLPGESTTSLVSNSWDTGRALGRDGSTLDARPGTVPRSAKARAMSEICQAARDARSDSTPAVEGDGASPADGGRQAVQFETDGGVRLAGGRLHLTSEHGDDHHAGPSEAGTVLPPPYAEY